MTKNLRTVKLTLIMGILLISAYIRLVPSCSAGIIPCEAEVHLDYNAEAANSRVVPLGQPLVIPINISYKINGIFAEPAANRFFAMGATGSINLIVGPTESWVTATITKSSVYPAIRNSWVSEESYVSVTFTQDAPANQRVTIPVFMEAKSRNSPLFKIGEVTNQQDIVFTPSFLPIIDATPKTTYEEISPNDFARFNIDLENLGNAETRFEFEFVQIPDGWTASMISTTNVASAINNDDNTKTIQLTVRPPYGFGYHDTREDIVIRVTGKYFAPSGEELEHALPPIRLTVQSKGLSLSGMEVILPLIILLIVVLYVIYYFVKKFKNK